MEGTSLVVLGYQQVQFFFPLIFLPPATKLRQGNVFTLVVCDSVHRWGLCPGGSASGGVSVRKTPATVRLRAGGTHPNGMPSCINRRSDEYVKHAYHLLSTQLEKNHSEIRLSCFLMIDELFQRSHCFREQLLADFQYFLMLVAGKFLR